MDEKPESKTVRLLNGDFPTKQVILTDKSGILTQIYKKYIKGSVVIETWSDTKETQMYCSECRTDIPDILYKYCPRCGARLVDQDVIIKDDETSDDA